MSESQPSKVVLFDGDDPEMQRAYERARATFRYFWREVAWERRRIIPGLDLAAVKAPFSDGPQAKPREGEPDVEHMWLDEVDFDGQSVSGVLLNSPNWLKSVQAGDSASIPLGQISDWMYAIDGQVYGAFTVNLLRSRMSRKELADHDAAWGLEFGDPNKIRLVPQEKNWFPAKNAEAAEHPMSEAMGPSFQNQLAEDPSLAHSTDDRGWTFLHHQALAGSAATVGALLDAGADPSAVTGHGMTPLALARSLGWDKVVALLAAKGAT